MDTLTSNFYMIVIHVTMTLISLAILCFLVGRLYARYDFGKNILFAGYCCLGFAALTALLTGTSGLNTYSELVETGNLRESLAAHFEWGIAAIILILISAFLAMLLFTKKRSPGFLFLMIVIIALSSLIISVWHGSDLIYRYDTQFQPYPNHLTKKVKHLSKHKKAPHLRPTHKKRFNWER